MSVRESTDDTRFSITYVDEIRPVLACHAKAKVSPEAGFLPQHLRNKKGQDVCVSQTGHICSRIFKLT